MTISFPTGCRTTPSSLSAQRAAAQVERRGTALVLNATYEPLCVVPTRRAAVLVLTEKAVSVTDGDGVLHSAAQSVAVPAVVRLTRFVKVPFRGQVSLTRRAIFARDRNACAYCGSSAATIDHVIPRSRGGEHVWENVVAACHRCNHIKADRTPIELGWKLRRQPTAPTGLVWRVLGHRAPDPRWSDWLGLPAQATA